MALTFTTSLPLSQGRDSLSISTSPLVSHLVSHLVHVVTTSPAILPLLVTLLVNLFLYYCLKPQYSHQDRTQGLLLYSTIVLASLSAGFTTIAALTIAIANNTYDISRYLFAPIVLSVVLTSALLFRLFDIFLSSNKNLFQLSFLIIPILFLLPANSLFHPYKPSPQLLAKESSIIALIKSDPPNTTYGFATSPPWHATTLTALSDSTLTIREVSSDGNPLFWHLWKGAFVNETGSLSLLSGKTLEKRDILPFSFVVTGPEESSLIKPFFGRPSRSIYCQNLGYNCLHYYNDSSLLMLNTAVFINTYGLRPKT